VDTVSNSSEPDESETAAAFGDIRVHVKSSEPYYWEQGYIRVSSNFPIPIDNNDKAQLFSPCDTTNHRPKQQIEADNCNKKVVRWQKDKEGAADKQCPGEGILRFHTGADGARSAFSGKFV